jgi:hypothetical protein
MWLKNKTMEINRQNYEVYLLDYIEGQLPENMVLAMLTFLKNNPDIELEANALMENTFIPETIKFDQKDTLKKNPDNDIVGISKFEQLSVASLENDISEQDLAKLNYFIDDDKAKSDEHKLIARTKLNADLSIVYPNKKQLKHFQSSTWLSKNRGYVALAASIALVVGFILFFNQNNKTEFGKTFARETYNFKNRPIAENPLPIFNLNVNEIPVLTIVDNNDSVLQNGKKNIEAIHNKQLAMVDIPVKNGKIPFSEIVVNKPVFLKNDDSEYKTLHSYLGQRFKEKILKQDKNEKVSLISVINAFGRFTKKVLNKKIEVEKNNIGNGASLYAIKTDTYDFYTIRNARKKSDSKELK